MLFLARVISAVMGITLSYSVLTGGMSIRIFIVPDLLLSVGLIVAAAMPATVAPRALLAANALAAGVFIVANSRYMIEDGMINAPVIAYLALAWALTLLLLLAPARKTR